MNKPFQEKLMKEIEGKDLSKVSLLSRRTNYKVIYLVRAMIESTIIKS